MSILAKDIGVAFMRPINVSEASSMSMSMSCAPGLGCSKLTTSLVNETLKFRTYYTQQNMSSCFRA